MPVQFPDGTTVPTVEELEASDGYKQLDEAGKLRAQQKYLTTVNKLGSSQVPNWQPQMMQNTASKFKQVGVEEGFDWSWKPYELAGEALASAPIVGDVAGRIIESGLNQADAGTAMLQARGQGELQRQLAALGTMPREAQRQVASDAYDDAYGRLALEQQRQQLVDPLIQQGDIFKKPISTIGKVAGQSLVSMLAGASEDAPVVGPIAAVASFAGPIAAGFRQEFPASVMEELREAGYDLSDPAVVERVLTDPAARADLEEAERVGKIRGGVIAAFDGFAQLAGGVVARGIGRGGRKAATEATEEAVGATLPRVSLEGGRSRLVAEGLGGMADTMKGRLATEGAVELVADAFGGGGGEYAARALAGQEQDIEDILMEATGGLATQAPATALSVAGAEGIAQNEAQKAEQAEAFRADFNERQKIIDTVQQYSPESVETVSGLLMPTTKAEDDTLSLLSEKGDIDATEVKPQTIKSLVDKGLIVVSDDGKTVYLSEIGKRVDDAKGLVGKRKSGLDAAREIASEVVATAESEAEAKADAMKAAQGGRPERTAAGLAQQQQDIRTRQAERERYVPMTQPEKDRWESTIREGLGMQPKETAEQRKEKSIERKQKDEVAELQKRAGLRDLETSERVDKELSRLDSKMGALSIGDEQSFAADNSAILGEIEQAIRDNNPSAVRRAGNKLLNKAKKSDADVRRQGVSVEQEQQKFDLFRAMEQDVKEVEWQEDLRRSTQEEVGDLETRPSYREAPQQRMAQEEAPPIELGEQAKEKQPPKRGRFDLEDSEQRELLEYKLDRDKPRMKKHREEVRAREGEATLRNAERLAQSIKDAGSKRANVWVGNDPVTASSGDVRVYYGPEKTDFIAVHGGDIKSPRQMTKRRGRDKYSAKISVRDLIARNPNLENWRKKAILKGIDNFFAGEVVTFSDMASEVFEQTLLDYNVELGGQAPVREETAPKKADLKTETKESQKADTVREDVATVATPTPSPAKEVAPYIERGNRWAEDYKMDNSRVDEVATAAQEAGLSVGDMPELLARVVASKEDLQSTIEGMTEPRKDRKPSRRKSKLEAKAEQIIEEGRGKTQARLDLGIDPVRTAAILTKGAFVAMRGAKTFANFSREMGRAYAKDWNALTGRQKRKVHRAATDPKVQHEEALKKLPEKYRKLVGEDRPESAFDFRSRTENTGGNTAKAARTWFDVAWGKMLPPRRVLASRINTDFGRKIRKFQDMFRVVQEDQQILGRFSDAVYARMPKDQVVAFDAALRDGSSKDIRKMAEDFGFMDEYLAARNLMDDLYQRAKDSGLDIKDQTRLRVMDKETGKMVVVYGDQVSRAEKRKAAQEGRLEYEYWPRQVADYKLLLKKIDELKGVELEDRTNLDVLVKKENDERAEKKVKELEDLHAKNGLPQPTKDEVDAAKKSAKMTKEQEIDFLTRYMQGYGNDRLSLTSDNFFAKRKYDAVDPKLQPFYKDTFTAMENFSFRLTETIAKRELIGVKSTDSVENAIQRSAESMGGVIAKMREDGLADDRTIGLIKDILKSIVANEQTEPAASVYRDITTMVLLGNWVSAALNIAEMTFAVVRHLGSGNPVTTTKEIVVLGAKILGFETGLLVENVGRTALRLTDNRFGWEYYANRTGFDINLAQLGVDSDAQSHILDSDFTSGSKAARASRRITDVVMSAAGFKLLDRVARLSTANLTAKALQRQAKKAVKTGEKKHLGVAMQRAMNNALTEDAQNKVVKDLADGKHSVEVAMLIGELASEMAPRNRIDMPVNYDGWGSYGKLAYQMLSFMLNRMSFFREMGAARGLEGRAKVYSRLQLMPMIALAFASEGGALMLQDMMLDREEEWDEKFVNVLFRTFGFSRYLLQQVERGDFAGAGVTALPVAPVLAFPENLAKDIRKALEKWTNPEEDLKTEDMRSLFMIPVVGRIAESRRGEKLGLPRGRGAKLATEKKNKYDYTPQVNWLGKPMYESHGARLADEFRKVLPIYNPDRYGAPEVLKKKIEYTDRRGGEAQLEMTPQEYQLGLKRVGEITRQYLGAGAVYDDSDPWHKSVTSHARSVAKYEFLRSKGVRKPRPRRPRRRGKVQ